MTAVTLLQGAAITVPANPVTCSAQLCMAGPAAVCSQQLPYASCQIQLVCSMPVAASAVIMQSSPEI